MVIQEYQRAVAESKTASPALKASLKTQDRVPAFIDRMCQEIPKAEAALLRKGRVVKVETLRWAVREMTELFLKGIEANANDRVASPVQRAIQAQRLDESLNPEKYLAEMDVITDDPAEAKGQEGQD